MAPRCTASGSSSGISEQIETLMEFLQEHQGLARGYLQGPEARATKNRLWDDITQKLNSLGGAIKTAMQWKKVHTTPALSGTPAVRPPRPTVARTPSVARLVSGMPTVCPPRPPTPRTPTVASGTPTVCPPSGRALGPRWRSQNRQVDVRAQLLEGERAKLAELVRIREMSGVREAFTQLVAEFKSRS